MGSFKIAFACGAAMGPTEMDEDPRKGERLDKAGRIRLAVFDSDTTIERPKLRGDEAPCWPSCPAKSQASGRKYTQCWPTKLGPSRWRHVVTCRGSVEEVTDEHREKDHD